MIRDQHGQETGPRTVLQVCLLAISMKHHQLVDGAKPDLLC
jgi:hypothetical protein